MYCQNSNLWTPGFDAFQFPGMALGRFVGIRLLSRGHGEDLFVKDTSLGAPLRSTLSVLHSIEYELHEVFEEVLDRSLLSHKPFWCIKVE